MLGGLVGVGVRDLSPRPTYVWEGGIILSNAYLALKARDAHKSAIRLNLDNLPFINLAHSWQRPWPPSSSPSSSSSSSPIAVLSSSSSSSSIHTLVISTAGGWTRGSGPRSRIATTTTWRSAGPATRIVTSAARRRPRTAASCRPRGSRPRPPRLVSFRGWAATIPTE